MGNEIPLDTFVFRYRGLMDWHKIYSQARAFFVLREMEFSEPAYKDKGNEFEGKWRVEQKIDVYNKIIYEIDFKAIDMVATTHEGKQMFNGKFWLQIKIVFDEYFTETSIAGQKELFQEESWLHKAFKKVTFRDREENFMGVAVIVAQQFMALLKNLCNMDAKL